MREPYASLEVLPFRYKGLLNIDTASGLPKVFQEHTSFKNAIEIGSYYGASAHLLGSIVGMRCGSLVCVDTWTPCDQVVAWDRDEDFKNIYEQFLSNVVHWGLTAVITPMRMTSLEAAAAYDGPPADLIYIDAYHTYDALKADMLAWWPHLAEGGIMCGDDFLWEGIPRAIGDACDELGDAYPTPTTGAFWKLRPKAGKPCLKE